jgi:hypothetical protein
VAWKFPANELTSRNRYSRPISDVTSVGKVPDNLFFDNLNSPRSWGSRDGRSCTVSVHISNNKSMHRSIIICPLRRFEKFAIDDVTDPVISFPLRLRDSMCVTLLDKATDRLDNMWLNLPRFDMS